MPIARDCSTGTSGITSPCSSPTCGLCNVILNGLVISSYSHNAIATFSTPSLADSHGQSSSNSKTNERPWTKTMILVDVLSSGKEVGMTREQLDANTKSSGQSHDFVSVA
jgi:hypothetical protein